MISSLKFLYSRRLRLAATAHTYPILLYIACYSCLLARTTRVGVTILLAEPLGDSSSITRTTRFAMPPRRQPTLPPTTELGRLTDEPADDLPPENLDAEEERLQRLVAEKE